MFLKPPFIKEFMDEGQGNHIFPFKLLPSSYTALVVVLETDVGQVFYDWDEDILWIIFFKLSIIVVGLWPVKLVVGLGGKEEMVGLLDKELIHAYE